MYFKRLEMHGFKSFAEPVVIDFHEGITCIVGPNGSGKSNISDAIRWVLGEQSPKALRGGKMEEVIFAGTASRKPRGMAEVTLVIDNSTGILDIDYNEVAITRRMYRSGESEYLINGHQCRLRDIRELIMDTGIGVDGYSLIGQGKIADIVSNKPESRREIFEEAAGVVMYKNKKQEAEKRLESTNVNLDRINDIIAEIERQITSLKDDSEKAKEFIKLRDEYREIAINIILRNIETIERNNKTYVDDLEQFDKDLENLQKEYFTAERKYDELEERKNALDRLGNETRDKIMSFSDEINRITSRQQLNQERLATIKKEKDRLNREIKEFEFRSENETVSLSSTVRELEALDDELTKANDRLHGYVVEYNVVSDSQASITRTVDESNDKLFRLHNRKTSAVSEAKSIESLKSSLRNRKTELVNLMTSMNKNISKYQAQADSMTRMMEQEQSRLDGFKDEYMTQLSAQEQLKNEHEDLLCKVEEGKIALSRVSSRKKTMEEMENNYEGYNFAVKSLMRATLPGIIGVAADLMNVPTGFEVAVETAMGASLQNVVCESDEDAKRGVHYLKTNRSGRLTFLPVSSVRGTKANLPPEILMDEGFLGVASDVISCEAKYRRIFDYLLGRVVIVNTMNTAIRLSKMASGVRFVTLEGEIINASGAITGGSYKNKTANILERKSEIKQLSEEMERLEAEIKKSGHDLERFRSKKEAAEAAVAEAKEDIRNTEINISNHSSRISSIQTIIEESNAAVNRYENELADIENQLSRTDDLITNLNQDASTSDSEIDIINRDMGRLMDELTKVKKQSEDLNEKITLEKINVSEISGKIASSEKMKLRIETAISEYSESIKTRKGEIHSLEEEENVIVNGRESAEADPSEKIRVKTELEEKLAKIGAEREVIFAKEKVLDEEKSRHSQMINALRDRKNSVEIKSAKNETQLESLKDKLWDEFEISFIQALELRKDTFSLAPAQREAKQIKERMKELGDVNIGSIKEYDVTKERYDFLTEQRKDITAAKDELLSIIEDMDSTIKNRFRESFNKVEDNFENIFNELFDGGQAKLILEDESNPLESGIEIVAQPPGKKLQNINLMSGGEKTMTAIALMFAVLRTKPTPFCILDEVEAALDDANIDRFANYLRKFDNIQFALVTHQKATMEHADVIYGVTMAEHGVSEVLSLRLGDDFNLD